jgi:hypothetical protein
LHVGKRHAEQRGSLRAHPDTDVIQHDTLRISGRARRIHDHRNIGGIHGLLPRDQFCVGYAALTRHEFRP